MKIFDTLFGRTVPGEIVSDEGSKIIEELMDTISNLVKERDACRLKKQYLEDDVIPALVKEHYFVDKNYFLPTIDILKYLHDKYIYFVYPKPDNSKYSRLKQDIQHLHYEIYYDTKCIEYIEDSIDRYKTYSLPRFIREDRLEKLNKNLRKRPPGEKCKYTKYEIKRRRLIRN